MPQEQKNLPGYLKRVALPKQGHPEIREILFIKTQ